MISLSDITDAVADHYHMSPDTLLSRNKARSVSVPRQMAYALSRDLTEASLSEIGRHYRRDHTSIHHGINRMAERYTIDPDHRAEYRQLDAACRATVLVFKSVRAGHED